MALCCQNRVCKGTNQRYGLRVSASISVHRTSVTVLGLLKKKELVQNRVVAVFRLATQNTLTVVINGFDRSELLIFTYNPSTVEFEPLYV